MSISVGCLYLAWATVSTVTFIPVICGLSSTPHLSFHYLPDTLSLDHWESESNHFQDSLARWIWTGVKVKLKASEERRHWGSGRRCLMYQPSPAASETVITPITAGKVALAQGSSNGGVLGTSPTAAAPSWSLTNTTFLLYPISHLSLPVASRGICFPDGTLIVNS